MRSQCSGLNGITVQWHVKQLYKSGNGDIIVVTLYCHVQYTVVQVGGLNASSSPKTPSEVWITVQSFDTTQQFHSLVVITLKSSKIGATIFCKPTLFLTKCTLVSLLLSTLQQHVAGDITQWCGL